MKDTTTILKQLRRLGFDIEQSKAGHWKIYDGKRLVTVIAFSPRSGQARYDIKRYLRKAGIVL